MLKNYFLVAWRNLRRNRGFSLVNIVGLGIGMTATLFILLWVQQERSWDKFMPHYDDIAQVRVNRNFNGEIVTDQAVSLPVGAALEQEIPQVQAAAFTSFPETHVMRVGEKILKQRGYRVSDHYFQVFEWTFLRGLPEQALATPDALVLTESSALALFGTIEVVDKVVKMDNDREMKITAVLKDPPVNATAEFQFISGFQYAPEAMQDWTNAYTALYVRSQPGTSPTQLSERITELVRKHNADASAAYLLHLMADWRLYSEFQNGVNTGGMIRYVRLFTAIAIIILIVACVNFMNLSTARAEKRAREVGVRKTLGSGRGALIFQFFSESVLLAIASFVFSLILMTLLLPAFRSLLGREIGFSLLDAQFWGMAALIIVGTGILAGSYPAIYLSGFQPVKVLKAQMLSGKAAVLPRRILVVGQFVIGIVLLSATFVIYSQISYVKSRDLGYNPNNLISVPTSNASREQFAAIRQELLSSGLISSITGTSAPLTDIWNYTPAPDYAGKPENANMILTAMAVGENFAKTAGVRILEGRDFEGVPADSAGLILNEAAVKTMGLKDPVGMEMRYFGRPLVVIGVAADVVMASPFTPVDPMMWFYGPGRAAFFQVRVADGVSPQKAISKLQEVFRKFDSSTPFEYQFIDEEFGQKFATENLISRLANIFAGLAIIICCLGLSGLTAFTVQRRIREIGIRKVMGASVQQLLFLLSREFLWLVALAILIAAPLAWYGMNEWLQQYSYRAPIALWQLAAAGLALILLTLATVWLNAWRATQTNPAKTLKNEG